MSVNHDSPVTWRSISCPWRLLMSVLWQLRILVPTLLEMQVLIDDTTIMILINDQSQKKKRSDVVRMGGGGVGSSNEIKDPSSRFIAAC